MKCYFYEVIQRDLAKKMIMLPGPRQVGKTYLAKDLCLLLKPSIY